MKKQITDKLYHSEKILECCEPEYLLVFEDGIGGPLELISAARKRNIIVAVCPYEISQRKDLENLISAIFFKAVSIVTVLSFIYLAYPA